MWARLAKALDETQHGLVRLWSGAWHCTACLARSSRNSQKQLSWLARRLATPCCDLAPGRPDPSHTLRGRSNGLVYCAACGAWSTRIYRALRAKCPRKPQTGLAKLALQRFAQGKGPPSDDYSLQPGFELAHRRLLQQLPSELFVIGVDQDSEEEEGGEAS